MIDSADLIVNDTEPLDVCEDFELFEVRFDEECNFCFIEDGSDEVMCNAIGEDDQWSDAHENCFLKFCDFDCDFAEVMFVGDAPANCTCDEFDCVSTPTTTSLDGNAAVSTGDIGKAVLLTAVSVALIWM